MATHAVLCFPSKIERNKVPTLGSENTGSRSARLMLQFRMSAYTGRMSYNCLSKLDLLKILNSLWLLYASCSYAYLILIDQRVNF